MDKYTVDVGRHPNSECDKKKMKVTAKRANLKTLVSTFCVHDTFLIEIYFHLGNGILGHSKFRFLGIFVTENRTR